MSEHSAEVEHNARAWDKLARQQVPLAQPATDADLSDPLAQVDPLGWLGGCIRDSAFSASLPGEVVTVRSTQPLGPR